MDEYQRHLTPAPVPLTKLATINDVLDGVGDHASECAAKRRKFAMWAITTGVAIAGIAATVGVFAAKYLIVGAITLELDRRFPHTRVAASQSPGLVISSAQASEATK